MSGAKLKSEADLAEELGVTRELLTAVRARALTPEEHWKLIRNTIVYTPAGEEKALAALAALPPEAGDGEATTAQAATATLYVKRAARHNKHMIFATVAEDLSGEELSVRVQNASYFVPRQKVQVTRDGGLWRLTGRQPRGRGHVRARAVTDRSDKPGGRP